MVTTLGNNIINAYTGGVQVKEIYSFGVKVWPVTPTPQPVQNNEIWYASTDEQIVTPYSIPSGYTVVSNTYTPGVGGYIVFDKDLTSIDTMMFYGKSTLMSIVLPSTVASIDSAAFRGCTNLDTVYLPASLNSISANSFWETPLSTIVVDSNNQIYDSRNDCNGVINSTTDDLVLGGLQTVIPQETTKIEGLAYGLRNRLTSITLPSNVTEVGVQAFYNCRDLVSVSMLGVRTIRAYAFAGCTSLTSVSMPNVLYIGYPYNTEGAFQNCTGLETVTIPAITQSIYYNAFKGCTNLSEVIMEGNTPPDMPSSSGAFDNCSPNLLIKVPASSLNAYKIATGWSDYANYIVGYSNTDEIDFTTLGLADTQVVDVDTYGPFSSGDMEVQFTTTNQTYTSSKYYTNGTAVRVYRENSVVISSSRTISQIEFTWTGGSSYRPSSDVATPSGYDYQTNIWTGSANQVTLTRPNESGHWRLKSILVTYL